MGLLTTENREGNFARNAVIAGVALTLVSRLAFHERVRRFIFARDNGTCQHTGRRFVDGWNVQAAHYPNQHQKKIDYDSDKGRILCTEAHIIEEIRRGNESGARKLYENQTIRTYEWINKVAGTGLGVHKPSKAIIERFDDRLPFETYYEWAIEGAPWE